MKANRVLKIVSVTSTNTCMYYDIQDISSRNANDAELGQQLQLQLHLTGQLTVGRGNIRKGITVSVAAMK